MPLKFKIVTPEKTVLEEMVEQVTLPTALGQITVLPKHLPLVAMLKPGELIAKTQAGDLVLAVSGGFVEVKPEEVIVLADTAERAAEINAERAEEAKRRAEQLLTDMKNKETVEYSAMAAQLEKELARLRVAKKHHTKHQVKLD